MPKVADQITYDRFVFTIARWTKGASKGGGIDQPNRKTMRVLGAYGWPLFYLLGACQTEYTLKPKGVQPAGVAPHEYSGHARLCRPIFEYLHPCAPGKDFLGKEPCIGNNRQLKATIHVTYKQLGQPELLKEYFERPYVLTASTRSRRMP